MHATARLVRLLLADPLGAKPEWEDYLEKYRADNEGGLLIKCVPPSSFLLAHFVACSNPDRASATGIARRLRWALRTRSFRLSGSPL